MRNSYPRYQTGGNPATRPGSAVTVDPRRLRLRMVREQIAERGIEDPDILAAMASVPRHLFIPDAFKSHAYDDSPVPIGYGQTISQPFMVACMTLHLLLEKGMRVLEIGAGSGYQAAILASLGCTVIGIERVAEIYTRTKGLLHRLGYRTIHLQKGDGTLGFPVSAPFERILVSAGGPCVPPPLVEQLAEKGVLLIPVGTQPRNQRLLRLRKINGKIITEDLGPATFVNLIGDHGWLD